MCRLVPKINNALKKKLDFPRAKWKCNIPRAKWKCIARETTKIQIRVKVMHMHMQERIEGTRDERERGGSRLGRRTKFGKDEMAVKIEKVGFICGR